MSGAREPVRNAASIVDDLYAVTLEMTRHLDDPDFLVEQIDKRQVLAEEFAAYRNSGEALYSTAQEQRSAEDFIALIAEMDRGIASALEILRDEAKTQLASLKTNQRVLGYTNAAISGSGSYMDYKIK